MSACECGLCLKLRDEVERLTIRVAELEKDLKRRQEIAAVGGIDH